MRAEILSIGTEILLGQITDTNAVFLAQRLAEIGIPLFFEATVGDNPARLDAVVRLALERSDLILCTGGLGPTEDDITAAGIAGAFGVPLEINEEGKATLEAFFAKLGRPLTANQYKQAMIPQGALLVPNPVGTAPGFILEKDGKIAIAFPGPPHEMHPMWLNTVGPYLQKKSGMVIFSRTLRFAGIGEGALEMELKELIDVQGAVTIAPYAKLGEVHIRLTARAQSNEEAIALIDPVEAQVRARVGRFLYGLDEETLEVVIGRMLREAGHTLAVAESCTGGLLGGRITNVAGSSDYFLGGVISYSNDLKERLLGVPPTRWRNTAPSARRPRVPWPRASSTPPAPASASASPASPALAAAPTTSRSAWSTSASPRATTPPAPTNTKCGATARPSATVPCSRP